MKYNAGKAPDPKKWLELSEEDMLAACESYHEQSKPHPPTPNPRLHAVLHTVVERQLAMNFPPQARDAMQRLIAGGLSRHEAIHAVGSVVAHHMAALSKGELIGPFDYAKELAKLNHETWKQRRGR